jgi:hypothetical protein
MRHLAESSFQSLSSRFGSISGCRSKVFLSPACGGVESSSEPIMEIPRFSEGLRKKWGQIYYGNKGIVEYWNNGMMEKDVTSYKLWVNTLRLAPNDRNKD